MSSVLLKKQPVIACRTGYRYCEKQEQYIAAGVCKKRSEEKTKCYRCYEKWRRTKNQLALPFLKK
jgi:hypothetical protein